MAEGNGLMGTVAVRSGLPLELNVENLSAIADWVKEYASPEQLAWASSDFKQLRDLLKAQKAATDLRIQAVRLECVALRRVAIAGLAEKLSASNRSAALWFGEMTDNEFEQTISDCQNATSPISFMRQMQRERGHLGAWFNGGHKEYVQNEPIDLKLETAAILQSLSDLESFTVAEAADALYDQLSLVWDSNDLPREVAGAPLREVIRQVLRAPEPGSDLIRIGERVFTLPNYVTWHDSGEWRRVPWHRALLKHVRYMAEMKQAQARNMADAAEELTALYEALESESTHETDSAEALFLDLFKSGKIMRIG
jgi:hypothetical protein